MSPLKRTSKNARNFANRSARFDVYGVIPASASRITRSAAPAESSAYSSDSEAAPGFPLGPPRRRLMETNSEYALRRGRKPASECDSADSSRSPSPAPSDDDVPGQPATVDACVGIEPSNPPPTSLERRHAPIGKVLSWLEKRYQDENCTSIVPTNDEVVRWLKRTYAPFMDPATIPALAEVKPWVEVEWKKHKSLGGRSLKKR